MRSTRWPSTCSRPRAIARRSTSACARRLAGSGRHRSVTTRSRASKGPSSSTSAPEQSRRAPITTLGAAAEFFGVPLGAPTRLPSGNARATRRALAGRRRGRRGARRVVRVRGRSARRAPAAPRRPGLDRRPALAGALRSRDRARCRSAKGRAPTTARHRATTRSPSRTSTSGRGTRRRKTGRLGRYPFGAAHDVLGAACDGRSRGGGARLLHGVRAGAARPGCERTRVAWSA